MLKQCQPECSIDQYLVEKKKKKWSRTWPSVTEIPKEKKKKMYWMLSSTVNSSTPILDIVLFVFILVLQIRKKLTGLLLFTHQQVL